MPLITDYRPDKFDDFVGSQSTITGVKAKLKSRNKPHAYLITGPSGTGKTTIGRIIAGCLGAHGSNFKEMDSADFRGIDTIREVRRNMLLAPIGKSKARVWLLDECHQLTKDAQEALLKALEDTPKHVYFILSTTNPEKLKATLKRRCTHFVIDPVSASEMEEHLKWIAKKEKKSLDDDALEQIIKSANGSIGIAMSLLDAIIDMDVDDQQDQVKAKEREVNEAIDLCRALIKGSPWKSIAKTLKGLKEAKVDPEGIRRAVLGYCTSILLNGASNDKAYLTMECFQKPFFDSPFPQLIMACYEVTMEE